MGEISKKLHRKLTSKSANLRTKVPKRRPGEPLPGDVKDIEMLIKDGLNPVHAAYVYIQQMSSYFAECVSRLPELKPYAKLVSDVEDEYMPSGPPMSPLTVSYFTCWAFYDLQFGKDCDTIGKPDQSVSINSVWRSFDFVECEIDAFCLPYSNDFGVQFQ